MYNSTCIHARHVYVLDDDDIQHIIEELGSGRLAVDDTQSVRTAYIDAVQDILQLTGLSEIIEQYAAENNLDTYPNVHIVTQKERDQREAEDYGVVGEDEIPF